jgi:feruloyl esterase
MTKFSILTTAGILTFLLFPVHSQTSRSSTKMAKPSVLNACESLQQANLPNTSIGSAQSIAEGGAQLGKVALPAHCLVRGSIERRTGADGLDYAIAFEMRLPVQWNGRFYYQANGGLDGVVVPAYGALGGGPVTGALMQGFAVLSSDAGHTAKQNGSFGFEPQARLNYGYMAVQKLTPVARSVIAAAYGKEPDVSYIGGCSNGGRHTMVAAARATGQYDGYIVGAPGYRLPYAALNQVWTAQQFLPLVTPGQTVGHPMNPTAQIPDLASGLTAEERRTVAKSILNRCDALDGAKDDQVGDFAACQRAFDVQRDVLTCEGARTGSCLTVDQKKTLAAVLDGGKTASGRSFYSSFPWDAGIAGDNWALWKQKFSAALDPMALGTIFTSPPQRLLFETADVTALLSGIQYSDQIFTQSAETFMMPPDQGRPVSLARMRSNGERMMVFHGVADPVFSINDTLSWMQRAQSLESGHADDVVRLFAVPGMNHCSGGPATDQFDMLSPLVRWVEQGETPDVVVAQARGADNLGGANPEIPATWSSGRSRPLCAYPKVARYNGSGSLNLASSFSCK